MDLNDYTSLPLPITTFTNTNNFLLPPPKPTFKAQNPSYTAPPNPNAPNPNAPNLNNNNNNSKNNNLPNEGIILNNIGHHGDVDQNMDGNRDMSGFIDGNKILPAYQTRRSTRQLEPTVLPFKATNEGLSPDRPRPILPTNSLSCHQCKTRRDPSLLAVCKNSAPRSDPRRGCIKLYCRNCLEKYYCQAHPAIDPLPCPYCRGCCSCSRCRRDQEQERLETLEKNGNLADISPRSAVFRACRAKKSNKKKKRPFGGKIARFRLLDPPSTQTSTVSGNTPSPFDDISSNCGDVILENGIHSSPRICLNKFPVLQHGDNSAFHAPRFPFGAAPPPLHPIFLATQQERASHAQSTRLLSPNSLMSSLSSTPILPGAQLPPKSSVGNGGNTLLAHPTGLNAPVMPPLLPPLLPNNGSGGGSGNFPPYLPQNNPHRSGNFPLFSSNQGGNCGNGLSLQSTNTSPHNLTASFELQSASKTASQSHSTPPLQTSSISISQIPSSSSSSGQNHTFYLGGGSLGGPYPNQLTALGSSQPILSTAATPVGGSSAGGFQFQMLTATPLSLSQSNRNGTPQTPFGRMSRLYQSPPPIQPNSQLGVDHQQLVNMLTTQPILPQPRL